MTTRRGFLRKAGATSVAWLATRPGFAAARRSRPNILYIMADDHAAHAIGAYGGRLAALNPTPVIDGLAHDGMLLRNTFCSNSICTPSRATILTGQYSHVNGVLDLGGSLAPEHQMLAIRMRQAGYQTAMIGKWHLKQEPNFDYYKVLPGQGEYHDPTFREKTRGPWPRNTVKMQGHSSDCITNSSLTWLKQRNRQRPFFLMHHFKAPHDLFEYAKRYEDYLADTVIPEPESLWKQPDFGSIATRGDHDELYRFIGTSIGRRHAFRNYTRNWARDESLSDDDAKRQAYQAYLKKYLRCVKGVDDNLRRLLDYLRADGTLEDTVIFYTADQGFMLGEHDYQDKRWMYEESERMPLIVRYPKAVRPGSSSDAIIENVDFAPTILDFAGQTAPPEVQGRSFRSILESGTEPADWRKAAYYRYWMHLAHHWNPAHFGLRTKHHKLIFYYGCTTRGERRTPPGWELYDLDRDPHEVHNVVDDPAYREIFLRLKTQLRATRERIGDTDERFPEIRAIVDEFWDWDEAARAKAQALSHEAAGELAKGRQAWRGGRSSETWISTKAGGPPLRRLDGEAEISRQAVYRVSHPGNASFNVDLAYLLSGQLPPHKPHAFHSELNAGKPHIVIRLDRRYAISAIRIVNRRNGFQERAAGLTAWVSDSGKAWRQVWQADDVQPEWVARLPDGTAGRYVKLGLPGKGTLHLANVTIFGH